MNKLLIITLILIPGTSAGLWDYIPVVGSKAPFWAAATPDMCQFSERELKAFPEIKKVQWRFTEGTSGGENYLEYKVRPYPSRQGFVRVAILMRRWKQNVFYGKWINWDPKSPDVVAAFNGDTRKIDRRIGSVVLVYAYEDGRYNHRTEIMTVGGKSDSALMGHLKSFTRTVCNQLKKAVCHQVPETQPVTLDENSLKKMPPSIHSKWAFNTVNELGRRVLRLRIASGLRLNDFKQIALLEFDPSTGNFFGYWDDIKIMSGVEGGKSHSIEFTPDVKKAIIVYGSDGTPRVRSDVFTFGKTSSTPPPPPKQGWMEWIINYVKDKITDKTTKKTNPFVKTGNAGGSSKRRPESEKSPRSRSRTKASGREMVPAEHGKFQSEWENPSNFKKVHKRNYRRSRDGSSSDVSDRRKRKPRRDSSRSESKQKSDRRHKSTSRQETSRKKKYRHHGSKSRRDTKQRHESSSGDSELSRSKSRRERPRREH